MEYLLEGLVTLTIVLIGWLHMRQNKLEDKIEKCVEKDAFEEVKEELKTAIELLTEFRVENARWHGLMERLIENDSKNS